MSERVISALGALVLIACAFACCPRALRSAVRWRSAAYALALLLVVAVLALRTPVSHVFAWGNDAINALLSFSEQGARFLFGRLSDSQQSGFVFAFQVLPSVVFFAALMSLLYHVRLMPLLIRSGGRFLMRWLGTSGPESFSTVADVFVGQTEAPLVIRPYVASLTRSELMACMTAGFASTAGSVLAAYVAMLRDKVPGIGGHLIACSVMAAPASLLIAKLMLPEVVAAEGAGQARELPELPRASGFLDAITLGTLDGLRLAVNVGAMLIVFLALCALVNGVLGWVGAQVFERPLSLELIFGWCFAPLAFLLGVSSEDVFKVAGLLGQKTVLNEFVAYTSLSDALQSDPAWISERSRVIVSYALCGFANFSSIGIQIGGYTSLAPERRAEFASLAPRAMLAGLIATSLVACIAGLLIG
ncbi:MAG TPA: nucleoside transporter C-terminal domain-containing protein [Polyangiales bacterium]|nr:nucleoside transporter C-terminal domain-containing protein [Polyangiales bacterium]